MEPTTMEGGRLIAQGTYGCIFDPPLLCKEPAKRKGKAEKGTLGKISEVVDVKRELDTAAYLKEVVPDYNKYFVLMNNNSVCTPKQSQQKERDLAKCEVVQQIGMRSMWHFTMPWGGLTIQQGIHLQTFSFLGFFERLLEIGAVMALVGFVHYDIHRSNMLINTETGLPRLIDFGWSFMVNRIQPGFIDDRWKRYIPELYESPFEPPEITMATGIEKGHLSQNESFTNIALHKQPLKRAESQLGLSQREQRRRFITFWNSSRTAQQRGWDEFFKQYWNKFDAWNIGVVLFDMYMIAASNPEMTAKDGDLPHGRIKEVLRGLLRMDPRSRLDCVEALNLWNSQNSVLDSDAATAWLEKVEAARRVTA